MNIWDEALKHILDVFQENSDLMSNELKVRAIRNIAQAAIEKEKEMHYHGYEIPESSGHWGRINTLANDLTNDHNNTLHPKPVDNCPACEAERLEAEVDAANAWQQEGRK